MDKVVNDQTLVTSVSRKRKRMKSDKSNNADTDVLSQDRMKNADR